MSYLQILGWHNPVFVVHSNINKEILCYVMLFKLMLSSYLFKSEWKGNTIFLCVFLTSLYRDNQIPDSNQSYYYLQSWMWLCGMKKVTTSLVPHAGKLQPKLRTFGSLHHPWDSYVPLCSLFFSGRDA